MKTRIITAILLSSSFLNALCITHQTHFPVDGDSFCEWDMEDMANTLLRLDYVGNRVYRNGTLERIGFDVGYIDGNGTYCYCLRDWQGNNRVVLAGNDSIIESDNYYPYGQHFTEGAQAAYSAQRWKFGDKEFDAEKGLNWHDFGARFLMPQFGLFTTQDPLRHRNWHLSPYLYCAASPIRFIDPTGENPVYNRNGAFLGNTSEGFSGMVLIYSGQDKLKEISKKSSEDLMKLSAVKTLDDVQLSENRLSGNALSAIWTNIAKHYEGKEINGKKFYLNSIKGGKIGFESPKINNANFSTYFYKQSKPEIVGTGNNSAYYENTVENLLSTIIYHEWYGHIVKGYSNYFYTHSRAFQAVKNGDFWESTTKRYKNFINGKIVDYNIVE